MAISRRAGQQRVSQITSIAAPTGGINDTDPLASMDPKYCLQLNNWFPANSSLITRKGYAEWALHPTSTDDKTIRTLIVLDMLNGSQRLFACTNSAILDATTSIDPMPVLVSGRSNGTVQYAQVSNTAGQFLLIVNGVDPMLLYNGTTFLPVVSTPTTDPNSPYYGGLGVITGVSGGPATFYDITVHKNRVWFIQANSMEAYYLDTDAVSGPASVFPLGGVFKRGGYLVEVTTWSFDSGIGMDDQLIFRTSTGEIAIYRGENPNDANNWFLVSIFFLASPVGSKPSADLGGDLILLTSAGIVPISQLVKGVATEALYDSAISRNISRTLNAIFNASGFSSNWELHNVSSLQAIIICIPTQGDAEPVQYVMNIINGSWARYTLPAQCMNIYNGSLVFGDSDGTVHIFGGNSYKDGIKLDGSGGVPVDCSMFPAYNYFGDPTVIKHYKLIRPILQSVKPVSMLTKINVDYDLSALTAVPSLPSATGPGGLWDAGIWDTALWGQSTTISRQWLGANGIGFAASALMRISSEDNISFAAMEWVFEPGKSI
jgi:hypothetical protein